MSELFDRRCRVIVGPAGGTGRRWDSPQADGSRGLRILFEIAATMKSEPNTATITIYNLSEASRKAMEETGLTIQVMAGYVDTMASIFVGDIEHAVSVRQGVDWITTIEARDGSRGLRETTVNRSYAGDTRLADIVDDVIADTGLSRGPISGLTGLTVTGGIHILGSARKALNKLLTGRGLVWSVQSGSVQIHEADSPAQTLAPLLGPETGLIGSPEVKRETNEAGITVATLTARSLLQPTITCGGRVKIDARDRDGVYRVVRLTHSGDTEGQEWYSTVEADL